MMNKNIVLKGPILIDEFDIKENNENIINASLVNDHMIIKERMKLIIINMF